MSETDRERRARWLQRALIEKGVLHFPPQGFPGWTEERFERAQRELRETLDDVNAQLPLDVEERADGTLVVRALAALN